MSEEGGARVGMAGRFRLNKCCCCLSLDQGARVVGQVYCCLLLVSDCSCLNDSVKDVRWEVGLEIR